MLSGLKSLILFKYLREQIYAYDVQFEYFPSWLVVHYSLNTSKAQTASSSTPVKGGSSVIVIKKKEKDTVTKGTNKEGANALFFLVKQ